MNILEKFSLFYTDLASMKISDLSNIYSNDVEFIDPVARHKGINAVEDYFSKLLDDAQHCHFKIHTKEFTDNSHCAITWTMTFTSSRLNGGNVIAVDGVTILAVDGDKIIYHRDYYDLGQMVYENVPLLGRIIKKIKRSMA